MTMNKNQRLRFTSRLISQVGVQVAQNNKDEAYKVIFDGFSELGGVYVKFLQILSARYEFKNVATVSAAKRSAVFDAVEPDEMNVHSVLKQELGPKYEQLLLEVQDKPFAAGSFGQVYFAKHQNGSPLIIKVLRPSLLKYIRFDLKVLRVIIRLIASSPFANNFNTKEIFKDFKETVLTETNYPKEVANGVYFYDYFKDHPNIVIPKSYPELSSSNILVQEYIEGLPMTDLLVRYDAGEDITAYVKEQTGSDLRTQMYVLGHELLYSTLAAAKIPGDPHAGNIMLLPNNKVGLIDFGITADPPENRLAFKDMIHEYKAAYEDNFDAGRLFLSGIKFFANRQYRAIYTVATAAKSNDPDFDLVEELMATVNKVMKQNSGKVDAQQYIKSAKIAPLFREAINENNRFALDIEFDGTVMLKAADTFMAMIDQMGMKNDLMPIIYDSVIQRIEGQSGADLKGKGDIMDLEQAIEIVGSWMQELIERDPLVFHSLVSKTRKGLGSQETTASPRKMTAEEIIKAEEASK